MITRRFTIVLVGTLLGLIPLAFYGALHSGYGVTESLGRVFISLAFIGVGWLAWSLYGNKARGGLLLGAGFSLIIPLLAGYRQPVAVFVAFWLRDLAYVFIFAVILVQGLTGPPWRWGRWVVAVTAARVGLLGLVAASTYDPLIYSDCLSCPRPGPYPPLVSAPALARVTMQVDHAIIIVASIAALVILILGTVRSRPASRRLMSAIWTVGAALFLGLIASSIRIFVPIGFWDVDRITWLLSVTIFFIPAAYMYTLVRLNLQTFGPGRFAIALGTSPPSATKLEELLAAALKDPSLELALWDRDSESYVDESGSTLAIPDQGSLRAVTYLRGENSPLAALIHDPGLQADASLVDAVAAVARLALENTHLNAELAAQLEEVSASRARLVEAADQERRRIERDLHDGAQQRLVSLALTLSSAERMVAEGKPLDLGSVLRDAKEEAQLALADLRHLAHGIHPAVLTERGLMPAIEALTERMPIPVIMKGELNHRFDPTVEAAAYYLVSEALANAVKHARATRVEVVVAESGGLLDVAVSDDGIGGASFHGGSGLRGLHDRIGALSGTLQITSAADAGTRVTAHLPCR